MPPEPPPSPLVLSYIAQRRAIGIIGVALPFVLLAGGFLPSGPMVQPSISDYYYTIMGSYFVGSLCAIGVFQLSYRGPDTADRVAGNLAFAFAVGVAMFPTEPATITSGWNVPLGKLHLLLASSLFLTLAYFSLVLFRRTNPNGAMTKQKKKRNVVYAVCGSMILVCIGLILINYLFLPGSSLQRFDPVFWLESIAVVSFGVSWLVKGETILADNA
ncbi:MAG TPA: hypothetical protein VHQ01_13365 [Pyrinomonadaceae bacterium]|nr:hypothetical protein [Pyrinomonadaceae bacterium]